MKKKKKPQRLKENKTKLIMNKSRKKGFKRKIHVYETKKKIIQR